MIGGNEFQLLTTVTIKIRDLVYEFVAMMLEYLNDRQVENWFFEDKLKFLAFLLFLWYIAMQN